MKLRLPWKKSTDWWFIWWLCVLLGLTLFICWKNYTPNTWLTGWDTLHPEFDFSLNISRTLWGAWREDQGVGAVAAHAHMSELPRILTLWVFDIFLPVHLLRYLYIFLCFILGPIGIYFFTDYLLDKPNHSKKITHLASFTAALIYLFNLGTVQHFYVVFEMFAVQYAFLGWLFLYATKLFDGSKRSNWGIFFFISFYSSSMAYASTLWFAYFGGLLLYLGILFLLSDKKRITFLRCFWIVLVTFAANMYWLLPNIYFLFSTASHFPLQSQTNQLFSPEAFLQNQEYGTLTDIPLLRNFLFNWLHYGKNNHFQQLLSSWQIHLQNPLIVFSGYLVFLLSLLGSLYTFVKKEKPFIALFFVWMFATFMLINANPPFTQIFLWLREHSSLFEEGLRFPFTKFSLLFMLCFSVFFGYFTLKITQYLLHHVEHEIFTIFLISSFWLVVTLSYGWPMFQGELISPSLRVSIPQTYFDFFTWTKTVSETARFTTLPAHSKVGWEYYNWGYEGAGFIWFGMKQPVLVRDFDRWNPTNETFYTQFSQALYANDAERVQKILQQYNVEYILVDHSAIAPNQNPEVLQIEIQEKLLESIGAKEIWSQDFLSVYSFHLRETNTSLISTIAGDSDYTFANIIYQKEGDYVENSRNSSNIYYPFTSLLKSDLSNQVVYQNSSLPDISIIQIEKTLSSQAEQLILPRFTQNQSFQTLAEISYINNVLTVNFYDSYRIWLNQQAILPHKLPPLTLETLSSLNGVLISINDQQFSLAQGQTVIEPLHLQSNAPITVSTFDISQNQQTILPLSENSFYKCWESTNDKPTFSSTKNANGSIAVQTHEAIGCTLLELPAFAQSGLVQTSIQYESLNGAKPELCLQNSAQNLYCQNSSHNPENQALQTIVNTTPIQANQSYFLHIQSPDATTANLANNTLTFFPPRITYYPLVAQNTWQENIWDNLKDEIVVPLQTTQENHLKIEILAKKSDIDLNDTQVNFGNCDIEKRGNISKQQTSIGTHFSAKDNGAACQGQNITLSTVDDAILRVQGTGTSGRGMKIYLTNLDNLHLDLEKLLPTTNFDKSFSIQGKPLNKNAQYSLNLENRSLGRIASENSITSIDSFEVPLTWLAQIKTLNENSPKRFTTPMKVPNSEFISLQLQNVGPQLIFNNQSFDNGWIAFPNWQFWKHYEHVKYNGWANAWIIDQKQPVSSIQSPVSVTILYWPQLLEFFGLGVLGGTFLLFLAFSVKKNRVK